MSKARLFAELRRRRGELVDLCARLIRIPSENPPGPTTELVTFIRAYLNARGIKPEIYEPQRGRPNLVATLGEGRPNLVLAAHLDEFPAGEGWSFPPFAGIVRDGKIMGRGAGDMKAGLAVALLVTSLVQELRIDRPGRLTLALASDEETGGAWGTQWLLKNVGDVRGDACLIGESSGTWSIGVGEKGVLWVRVSASGVSGHAAYGQGESAIDKVLAVLDSITSFAGLKARAPKPVTDIIRRQRPVVETRWGHGTGRMVDRLTTSIGTIRGGGQVNLISAACEADVDLRLPPGMTTRTLEALIRRRVKALRLKGVELAVVNRCDPYVTSPHDRLIRSIAANARTVVGSEPYPVIRLGYTDGRFFRRQGIPTAVFGPRVQGMGGPDESVEQDEVLQVALVHAGAILDYLSPA
jgi:succinyl-diaminopimelate desuccinylase